MNDPDVFAEGLVSEESREFRRSLELFVEGVAAWEPSIPTMLEAA
jgi:hypothetical protein